MSHNRYTVCYQEHGGFDVFARSSWARHYVLFAKAFAAEGIPLWGFTAWELTEAMFATWHHVPSANQRILRCRTNRRRLVLGIFDLQDWQDWLDRLRLAVADKLLLYHTMGAWNSLYLPNPAEYKVTRTASNTAKDNAVGELPLLSRRRTRLCSWSLGTCLEGAMQCLSASKIVFKSPSFCVVFRPEDKANGNICSSFFFWGPLIQQKIRSHCRNKVRSIWRQWIWRLSKGV